MSGFFRRCSWAAICLLFLVAPLLAETALPSLQARVTDQANLLDATARQALEAKLAALEQTKGSQIAVLIVGSTAPETIEQYSIRVVDAWRLGRKNVDDGVLMLFAMQDRAMRIEVGRGLEGAIPDAIAKRVIAEVITPYFQRGDFAGGIDAGVVALTKLVEGEPLPAPAPVAKLSEGGSALGDAGPTILIISILLGSILGVFFGRLIGAGVAGSLAFFAGWLVMGTFLAALVAAALAFVFTLMRGAGGGRSSGGGGWGGGGGGGFGGGGGGFGGGGASGRW